MDTEDARRIAGLAEAADSARATPAQDAADQALAAKGRDVVVAVETLLRADPGAGVRFAGQLSGFWQDAGLMDEGREVTSRAFELAGRLGGDPDAGRGAGRVALVAADLAFRQGDQEAATRWAGVAIDLATAACDSQAAGLACLDLARVAYREGNALEIEAASRRADALAPDDPLVQRGVLHMLAWAAHTAGDIDEGRRRFEVSLALRRAQGGALGIASELANLGDLALDAGDRVDAGRWFSEALDVATAVDSQYFVVNVLPSFAALAVGTDSSAAVQLFGAADAASAASGLRPDPGADQAEARAKLREGMPATFDNLLEQGKAMSSAAVGELIHRIARGAADTGEDSAK